MLADFYEHNDIFNSTSINQTKRYFLKMLADFFINNDLL